MGAWDSGSSRRWRRLRAAVLADNQRDNGGRCTVALEGVCEGLAVCVHHVLGRAVTGDDPRYLAACCRACNLAIGEPAKHRPEHRPISKW